ncbi:MAG: hypothetical protein HY725_20720 [Candidatus Rokubacteria bacterium]|nr:hypothetical protein [Candidatus Rokubacteria bacterium]
MATGILRGTLFSLLGAALLVSGCVSLRELAGFPAESSPTVGQKRAAQNWVLIKNPRFGDLPSEPEYIWVEEDRIPTTVRTLLFGKKSILAPPEVVSKYGSPPGGGRISPLQGAPYVSSERSAAPAAKSFSRERKGDGPSPSANAPAEVQGPPRGYVVFVDTARVVVDLTAKDGLRPGSTVSLRRDRIPIVHPVTGELLGELDEEVGTARVVEVREKFSVAEIQGISPGTQIKLKDRVVPR